MMRALSLFVFFVAIFLSVSPSTNAQDVSDHVALKVLESCDGDTGKINITITPLGETQIPGPPGIAILQTKDTGMVWKTSLPIYIESEAEYFPAPPEVQLSYLAGPQHMPELIADFAYCPTVEECLFATEKLEVRNICK